MKKNILYAFLFASLTFLHYSCQKEISFSDNKTSAALIARNSDQGQLKQTKTFSSDVAIQWMNMQVWQMYKYPGIVGNVAYSRHYAYSGIALYEAVVPGMPAYQSIAPQLNGLSGLPKTRSGKIMRRILRKIAENDLSNLGDISTLLDPGVVEEIKNGKL